MNFLVADIGGTRIKPGVYGKNRITASNIIQSDSKENFQNIINKLDNTFKELLEESGIKRDSIKGVGLALTGIINVHTKKVIAINLN